MCDIIYQQYKNGLTYDTEYRPSGSDGIVVHLDGYDAS